MIRLEGFIYTMYSVACNLELCNSMTIFQKHVFWSNIMRQFLRKKTLQFADINCMKLYIMSDLEIFYWL